MELKDRLEFKSNFALSKYVPRRYEMMKTVLFLTMFTYTICTIAQKKEEPVWWEMERNGNFLEVASPLLCRPSRMLKLPYRTGRIKTRQHFKSLAQNLHPWIRKMLRSSHKKSPSLVGWALSDS
tara:strand:+ start:20654 stop:21025 length:372 start_codon:yes stop_codon:yes gene_type:complete